VIVVSSISLIGIFTLSLREKMLKKYIFLFVSLATGALLGDALIHLIPESFEELSASIVGLLVITGILLFFVLEKFLHWHHYHGSEDQAGHHEHTEIEPHTAPRKGMHPVAKMIIVSDALHNLLDGAIIGASFLVSAQVGIATTVAVILHEIPQEIGDFGVLLHFGMNRMRALFVNFASALFALMGAFIVLFIHGLSESIIPWLVPIAAGGFLYIASSDLIPQLHKTKLLKQSLAQLSAIILGVILMYALIFLEV
jgi:zinc and cadmium transporter